MTSDFFLNEKRFLHGIDGKPNQKRMSHFGEALTRARELAKVRQKINPNDGETLFALTLVAGMESDAESILQKKHKEGLKRMNEASEYDKRLLPGYPRRGPRLHRALEFGHCAAWRASRVASRFIELFSRRYAH